MSREGSHRACHGGGYCRCRLARAGHCASRGADHGYLRVIDESEEDYLYDSNRFFPITIAQKLEKALKSAPANKSLQRTAHAPRVVMPLAKRKTASGAK
jgi:hypothetical protein